jgi:hypothetical protein
MAHWTVFPDKKILPGGFLSDKFLELELDRFQDACRYVHELPYGYNANREDPLILFKENKGSCTTKHAVIATLAEELALPIKKSIAIYAMTEDLVTGSDLILDKLDLPYIPMIHCFLVYRHFRIDLTEGNHNGKNRPVKDFLFTRPVAANISAKEEYLLYRKALAELVAERAELKGIPLKRFLRAREEGLALLRANIL